MTDTRPQKNPQADAAAALLRDAKVVLFCGAGISQDPPAGLPDWHELRDYTLGAVGHRDDVSSQYILRLTSAEMLAQPGKRGLTPEVVASVLADSTESYFDSLRALQDGEPNANHLSVAALAKQRYLRCVVTTNFDLFLERALEKLNVPYRVYRGADEFAAFDPASDDGVLHLLKIHGCLGKPDTITATIEQEGQGLPSPIRAAIEHLVASRWVLFWGYSGADLKIDLDYLSMVSQAAHAPGFMWSCFRSNDFEEHPHPVVLQLAAMYGARAVIGGGLAPDAIEGVLTESLRPTPTVWSADEKSRWLKSKQQRLLTTLEEWATQSIDAFTACQVIGDLLNVEGARVEAIACYERMAALAQSANSIERMALAAVQKGSVLREIGQFTDSYSELKEAERLARESREWPPLYVALHELGTLYSNWGRHSDALACLREAESLVLQSQSSGGESAEVLPLSLREALARCYLRLGYTKNFLEHVDVLEPLYRALGDKRSLCRVLNMLCVSRLECGEWDAARKTGEEWLALARVLGYRKDIGYALVNLAQARIQLKDDEQALADLKEAAVLAQAEPGDRLALAIHSSMAALQARRGQTEDARRSLQAALDISRTMGADHDTALAAGSLASVGAASLSASDRLGLLDESLRLLEQTGDAQRSAQTAEEIGDLQAGELNAPDTAMPYYWRALANWRLRNIGEPAGALIQKLQRCASRITGVAPPTVLALIQDAASNDVRDKTGVVRQLLEQDAKTKGSDGTLESLAASLERDFGAGAGGSLMMRLHNAGSQLGEAGDRRQAALFHAAAYRIALRIQDLQHAGVELNESALLAVHEGAFVAARQLYERSLAIAEQTTNYREQATCLFNLGRLAERMKRADEALEFLTRAAALCRDRNLPRELALSCRSLGEIYRAGGAHDEALRWFQQAEPTLREMGDIDDLVGVLMGLGKSYRELGQFEHSVRARKEAARLLEGQGDTTTAAGLCIAAGRSLIKELQQPQAALALLEHGQALLQRIGRHEYDEQVTALIAECRQSPGATPLAT